MLPTVPTGQMGSRRIPDKMGKFAIPNLASARLAQCRPAVNSITLLGTALRMNSASCCSSESALANSEIDSTTTQSGNMDSIIYGGTLRRDLGHKPIPMLYFTKRKDLDQSILPNR